MPSSNSQDKARQQNEIRRAQKAKRRHGGKRNFKREDKEPARLSRFVKGMFSPDTKTLLTSIMMEQNRVITSRVLVKLMFDGKLSVIVTDEENPLIHGKTYFVTSEGFKDEEGNPPGFAFYSVTVETGNGFGVQFRWDKNGRMLVG